MRRRKFCCLLKLSIACLIPNNCNFKVKMRYCIRAVAAIHEADFVCLLEFFFLHLHFCLFFWIFFCISFPVLSYSADAHLQPQVQVCKYWLQQVFCDPARAARLRVSFRTYFLLCPLLVAHLHRATVPTDCAAAFFIPPSAVAALAV